MEAFECEASLSRQGPSVLPCLPPLCAGHPVHRAVDQVEVAVASATCLWHLDPKRSATSRAGAFPHLKCSGLRPVLGSDETERPRSPFCWAKYAGGYRFHFSPP